MPTARVDLDTQYKLITTHEALIQNTSTSDVALVISLTIPEEMTKDYLILKPKEATTVNSASLPLTGDVYGKMLNEDYGGSLAVSFTPEPLWILEGGLWDATGIWTVDGLWNAGI